jgi:hypothetical protein
MNITYIKNSMIGLLSIFTMGSCVDLTEDISGQPTADKFFSTVEDFNSFVAEAYAPLIRLYGWDSPYIAGAGAEDVHHLVVRWKGFEEININAVSNPGEITNDLWKAYYTSIGICNTILQIIRDTESSDEVLQSVKETLQQVKGEAQFLRAFNYFQMVRWFGEVAALTEDNQNNAVNEPQSSIADLYNLIVDDLKGAENNLPSVQSNKGKPDRLTAKALLSKVYLAMAGFPLNQTSNYALARDKAKEVIDADVYKLEPVFGDLWLWNNRLTNSEFIFAFYANSNSGTGGYVHRAVRPWDHNEEGWGDWESDKRFFEQFPVGDGSRVSGTFYLTMRDGVSWENTDYAQPYVGKLRDAGEKSGGYWGAPLANIADGFFCMIRYADILLVYAEAANQAEGSPSATAYNALNEVRERAGLTALSGLNKETFDKAVLDERKWELAFECNRWFDLCRRHILADVMGSWYPHSVIDDHNYLLPKPTDQLAVMKGIRQNPGY